MTEFAHTLHKGYESRRFSLFEDDCLSVLRSLEANSADSLVTDPPAGIAFMGKAWDSDKGGRRQWIAWLTEIAAECLRVLKPGAHGLVWALPRTAHWTATALEDAGFEVRDCVTHLFGTGFPKSLDVSKAIDKAAGAEREVTSVARGHVASNGNYDDDNYEWKPVYERRDKHVTDAAKQWQGFGTALKPACEFWWLVRKPLGEKTVAANVLKWGTGAINIDASRIGTAGGIGIVTGQGDKQSDGWGTRKITVDDTVRGRFPANLVLTCCGNDPHDADCAAAMLDAQSGILPGGGFPAVQNTASWKMSSKGKNLAPARKMDSGGASRFFFVAKASSGDRGKKKLIDNRHPTVKSTALMKYLIKLVTPPNGVVLDPFMGSGTTGVSALEQNFRFIGIEKDAVSFKTAKRRLCKTPCRD